ncbi:hypothetical protein C2E23DRAFT_871698 [Lenzites betulinus]|nr:hypothetical protein C2E23DRAFT_871698 [Lenzites betulinus]
MSDYDSGAYKGTPHNSFYPDSSQGRPPSGYPPSSRRTPRYSRPSNQTTSWVSNGNGMLSPPPFAGPPSTTGSRPLPVPSPTPSRGMSDSFRPHYPSPSEVGEDPHSYRSGPADPEPEEWDLGQSEEGYNYNPYQDEQHQDIPEYESQGHGHHEHQYDDQRGSGPEAQPQHDSFYDPISLAPEPEPEPLPKKKTFVGGFVAHLRKLPHAVVKSHLYDRKATRKGAPGTEQMTGPSHYLPAYDEPGVTVEHPESVHYVEAVGVPTSPRSPSQLSYMDASRPVSGVRSQRHSAQSNPHSAILVGSPRLRPTPSPVLMSPHPASDYAKMDSPVRFAPPDDSFSAHLTRVKGFVHELKALPWTSSRVALDYDPTKQPRACTGKAKQGGSWYTGVGPHQDIDLLGSARPASRRLRSEDGASARIAVAHDGRTPASFVTSPGLMTSPGMSSHGQGQQGVSYSYYFAPPQPLYVYQSPMTSPAHNHQPPLTDSSSSSSRQREAPAQAVPVYMMAGPPPGLIPTPPPAAHTPGHSHVSRTSPHPPPPGLPVAQVASHHSRAGSQ